VILLHADESVDRRVVDGLRRRGVDVGSAVDAGLGGATDERQLEFATTARRALLTADADHLAIHGAWMASGRSHEGVVYFHPARTTPGHVIREVHRIAHRVSPDDARNRVFYVSRDRGPPRP
jgi:hypothetical protein